MNSVQSSPYGLVILAALQDRNVYQGTASPWKVAKQRAKNRVARVSRRVNRKNAK